MLEWSLLFLAPPPAPTQPCGLPYIARLAPVGTPSAHPLIIVNAFWGRCSYSHFIGKETEGLQVTPNTPNPTTGKHLGQDLTPALASPQTPHVSTTLHSLPPRTGSPSSLPLDWVPKSLASLCKMNGLRCPF